MNRTFIAQISGLRTFAAVIVLLLTLSTGHAVLLDWSTVTWSGTSRNYNVDGVAGNDITVAYTTANTVNFQNGTPNIQTNLNGIAGSFFVLDVLSLNTTGTITVTITFTGTYAAGAKASFTLVDVDARSPGQPGGTNYFQDKVNITALNGAAHQNIIGWVIFIHNRRIRQNSLVHI